MHFTLDINKVWIANTEIGLDSNKSVIKIVVMYMNTYECHMCLYFLGLSIVNTVLLNK